MAKVVGYALVVVGVVLNAYGQVYGSYFIYAGQALIVGDALVEQRNAKRKARNDYNASLQDRLEMIDVTPDQARTLVMGRVRTVEGVRRKWVSGPNSEKLTMIVSFAGHEIDAFETFYFDDIALTLDGQGRVQTAPYSKGLSNTRSVTGAFPADSTETTVELPEVPVAGSVSAYIDNIEAEGPRQIQVAVASVVGTTVTIIGGVAGVGVAVVYGVVYSESRARIRFFTGAPGQNVGAAIAADYPGEITAADRFEGMAVAVIDIDYDPDVFVQGRPNVTAVLRGARVLDPRTGATAWSENPALQSYHYARHASGWAVPEAEIRTSDVMAAADACDVSTSFTVRSTSGAVSTVTLPRYRSGTVIPLDRDPRDAMDSLMQAMAGRWGWAGGVWRLRAGVMGPVVDTVTPAWISQRVGEDGEAVADSVVSITIGVPRDQRVNRITGICTQPATRWQALPFPAVQDAVLIAAKGVAAQEITFEAVNTTAHAQHLASVLIRESQASLRMQLSCNLFAWRTEIFDVLSLQLPRYGMTGKTAEVVGWRWHPTEGVTLRLSEITPQIFDPVFELTGVDPAPNSNLPPPWLVLPITGLQVESGTVSLTDGSLLTRTRISWDPVVQQSVRAGGTVQVQYIEPIVPLPEEWPLWDEAGSATEAIIPALKIGTTYLFRARAISAPPLGVRSAWGATVPHTVSDAPFQPGLKTARVLIYQRAAAVPLLPSVPALYTFVDGTLANLTNGWSIDVPAGSQPLYIAAATAAGTLETDTIDPDEWTAPVIFVSNGFSQAVLYLYKRIATDAAPTVPSATLTYTFATGLLAGDLQGWAREVPDVVGGPYLWLTTATALGYEATDTVAAGEWATPQIFATAGAPGASGPAGTQAAPVYLYQWSPSQPNAPTGLSAYTWATATNAGYTGGFGWQVAVPTNPGTSGLRLWVASKQISAPAGQATTTVDWTSGVNVQAWAANGNAGANGQAGSPGAPGVQSATPTVYQWAATIPLAPLGSPTYTWATALFGAAPSGWSLSPGAPTPGFTLWAASVPIVDSAANATTGFNWVNATITARGYAAAGAPGQAGASSRIAYAKSTSFNLATTPSTVTTTGNAGFPPTNSWGGGEAWGALVPAYGAGEAIFQTDGIYSPATGNTVWGVPYLSNLKVGNLSAITVNTGDLNVNGDMTIAAGGSIKAGAFTGFGFPATGTGFYLGQGGLLLGNPNVAGTGFLELDSNGNIYSPHLQSVSGQMTFNGTFKVGTALRAGTTMTGTGAVFSPSGVGSWGNAATNLTFDGFGMSMNGRWVYEQNISFSGLVAYASPASIDKNIVSPADQLVGTIVGSVSGGVAPYAAEWSVVSQFIEPDARAGTIYIKSTSGGSNETCQVWVRGQTNDTFVGAQILGTVRDGNGRSSSVRVPVKVRRGTTNQ